MECEKQIENRRTYNYSGNNRIKHSTASKHNLNIPDYVHVYHKQRDQQLRTTGHPPILIARLVRESKPNRKR